MANLSIGDKIPSHLSSRTGEGGGKRASTRQESMESHPVLPRNDSVDLASTAPQRLERPLSRRIGDAATAQDALQRLTERFREQPGDAVAAQSGIGQALVNTLLRPPGS